MAEEVDVYINDKKLVGTLQVEPQINELNSDYSFLDTGVLNTYDNWLSIAKSGYDIGMSIYGKARYNFDINIDNGYATISGARSPFALDEGIPGTRYAEKNALQYPNVFKYSNTLLQLKESFSPSTVAGKIGILGTTWSVSDGIYNGVQKGTDPLRIFTDAGTDIAFAAGNTAVTGVGAAIGGTVAGPIGSGLVGLGANQGYVLVTEGLKVDGTSSVKDLSKEVTYSAVKAMTTENPVNQAMISIVEDAFEWIKKPVPEQSDEALQERIEEQAFYR